MLVAGHAQFVRVIGDILLVLRYRHGGVRGVVLTVHVAEPMTIAVLASAWPATLQVGPVTRKL